VIFGNSISIPVPTIKPLAEIALDLIQASRHSWCMESKESPRSPRPGSSGSFLHIVLEDAEKAGNQFAKIPKGSTRKRNPQCSAQAREGIPRSFAELRNLPRNPQWALTARKRLAVQVHFLYLPPCSSIVELREDHNDNPEDRKGTKRALSTDSHGITEVLCDTRQSFKSCRGHQNLLRTGNLGGHGCVHSRGSSTVPHLFVG
jgi:hypothetical protein